MGSTHLKWFPSSRSTPYPPSLLFFWLATGGTGKYSQSQGSFFSPTPSLRQMNHKRRTLSLILPTGGFPSPHSHTHAHRRARARAGVEEPSPGRLEKRVQKSVPSLGQLAAGTAPEQGQLPSKARAEPVRSLPPPLTLTSHSGTAAATAAAAASGGIGPRGLFAPSPPVLAEALGLGDEGTERILLKAVRIFE